MNNAPQKGPLRQEQMEEVPMVLGLAEMDVEIQEEPLVAQRADIEGAALQEAEHAPAILPGGPMAPLPGAAAPMPGAPAPIPDAPAPMHDAPALVMPPPFGADAPPLPRAARRTQYRTRPMAPLDEARRILSQVELQRAAADAAIARALELLAQNLGRIADVVEQFAVPHNQ